MNLNVQIDNLDQTHDWARFLAPLAQQGDVITLTGPLGAGKTTFIQAFCMAKGIPSHEVVSPTFSLVHCYDTPIIPIWHFDLYRLQRIEELEELGLEEALHQAITWIEWPQLAYGLLPADRLDLQIVCDANGRTLMFSPSETWAAKLRHAGMDFLAPSPWPKE